MRKIDACKLLSTNQTGLAKILLKTKGAISQWDNELTDERVNIVLGAAARRGINIPDRFIDRVGR